MTTYGYWHGAQLINQAYPALEDIFLDCLHPVVYITLRYGDPWIKQLDIKLMVLIKWQY
jgi:hypothetical protein